MAKITGIGGVFLRCADKEATIKWYAQYLGIQIENWGGVAFLFGADTAPEGKDAYAVLSFMKNDSTHIAPSEAAFMLNLRVDDLDAFIANLTAAGIELVGTPVDDDYGKFAWIMDPNGIKIELWQQK